MPEKKTFFHFLCSRLEFLPIIGNKRYFSPITAYPFLTLTVQKIYFSHQIGSKDKVKTVENCTEHYIGTFGDAFDRQEKLTASCSFWFGNIVVFSSQGEKI